MKNILKTYRPTFYFIGKFILTYLVMVAIYNVYLSQYDGQTDALTVWVGKFVTDIYNWFGLNVQTLPLTDESGLKLIINGNYVARIVEGCTAISVIILFVAFVISFGQNFKKSLVFATIGSLLIFIFNLFRIVFLGYLVYAYPQFQDVAHRIVFPALIYGFVVLLWLVFIKKIND